MPAALDVCVTLGARSRFRVGCAISTLDWWCQEAEAGHVARVMIHDLGPPAGPFWQAAHVLGLGERLHAVGAVVHAQAREGSQRARHAWAAAWAETDPYVLTDDDLVLVPGYTVTDAGRPNPRDWTDYAAAQLLADPRLAMVVPIPTPGGLPEVAAREAAPDGHRWSVSSVGGLRVVRRGAIPSDVDALPPMDARYVGGYDSTLCGWLEKHGRAVAVLVRLQAIHLGYARSTAAAVDGWRDEEDTGDAR
ncbi:MAG: hypothetical protein Q8O71_01610 [bacterium]|nr:hypothetical protein [bacterium]